MSRTNQFGLWEDGSSVEQAVINTLVRWLPSAAGEVERKYRLDAGTLRVPLYWSTENVFTKDHEEHLPAGIVISPGLNSEPRREGNGSWVAEWKIGVAVVDGADSDANTSRLVKAHAAAIRIAIMQNRGLDGSLTVNKVEWLNEQYDDVPSTIDDSTIGAAQVVFAVEIRDTLNDLQGPLVPTVDPRLPPRPNDPGPWPVAETVDITLRKESL